MKPIFSVKLSNLGEYIEPYPTSGPRGTTHSFLWKHS